MIAGDEAIVLDRMAIGGTAAAASPWAGSRRLRVRGSGLEFHEYRAYQPGDDPRSIDWTAEARLRQLVVKVSKAEGGARVHLLVDVSASMGIGEPSKLACARRLAAALCYVAIARREAASACTFTVSIDKHIGPASGRSQLVRVMALLDAATPSGGSSLDDALFAFGSAVRGPGLVVILSDFMDPGRSLAGFHFLLHRGFTPAVVQVVAPEEVVPVLHEETELFDVECASTRPLVVDASFVDEYRRRLEEHCATLRGFCAAHHLSWTRITTDLSFRHQVAHLEQAGLLVVRG